MTTTELIETAEQMGIVVEVANGRVQLGGRNGHRAGELVKLFASLGCDVERDHDGDETISWEASSDGQPAGHRLPRWPLRPRVTHLTVNNRHLLRRFLWHSLTTVAILSS
jgi:hypothetical protein